jgi:hypothetical protein
MMLIRLAQQMFWVRVPATMQVPHLQPAPQTVWVTCTVNGCESEAEPVVITVSPATQAMMDGSIAYYCPGGAGVDPTLNLEDYVINFQSGGIWSDLESTGVDLSDPSAVDFTGIANGVYQFEYELA